MITATLQSMLDDPDTWTELGFVAPEDEDSGESLPLGTSCFEADFSVDSTAEIMGTQVSLGIIYTMRRFKCSAVGFGTIEYLPAGIRFHRVRLRPLVSGFQKYSYASTSFHLRDSPASNMAPGAPVH